MHKMRELVISILGQTKRRNTFFNKYQVYQFIDELFKLLFENQSESSELVMLQLENLEEKLTIIINDVEERESVCNHKAMQFFQELPNQYKLLLKDAEFILDNDPAAKTIEEVYSSYLGFFAISVYRFAHQLLRLEVPLVPRVFTEYAHSKTGVDINPGAKIGEQFFIDHGTGIVIGETAQIGNRVKIYQGVTLGALSVSKDKMETKRHPTIENDVVIYSGATILGGETVIGRNSIIGGNVWLTNSVEPNSKVFHKSQIIVKGKKVNQEPINFVI